MENEMENGTRTARPADDVLRTAPNREAAAAIRSRARTNARVLRELKPEARAHAFAVAGIEDMERLRRVQEAVAKVPEGGDWAEARGQIASALGDLGKAKDRAGDGHSVVLDWNAARGHDAAVYHNHPGVLPDLSPEDVLASLAHGATEVGSVSGGGAEMRLRFLVGNNPELAGTIRGFRDRIRAARTIGERLRAAEEWDEWIKLHGTKSGTGLFRIKGTAL